MIYLHGWIKINCYYDLHNILFLSSKQNYTCVLTAWNLIFTNNFYQTIPHLLYKIYVLFFPSEQYYTSPKIMILCKKRKESFKKKCYLIDKFICHKFVLKKKISNNNIRAYNGIKYYFFAISQIKFFPSFFLAYINNKNLWIHFSLIK